MSASLVNAATHAFTELGEVTILGRKKESTICLPDGRVSRRHAMVRRHDDGGYWFYDLGSYNGSYINGQRVTTIRRLRAGDRIRIADFEFRFLAEGTMGGQTQLMEDTMLDRTLSDIRTVPVIILVSDIKGFTKLSERLPPDELAQTIGSWYRDCDEILSDCGATVDKYIGDAVLAYWTDVSPPTREKALVAARELRQSCEHTYNERREVFESHGVTFDSGVALHIGSVALGQMGKGEFTMLGDAVNVAFRLQDLTRKLGVNVVASGEFMADWDGGAGYGGSVGEHEVKGRTAPVHVFGIRAYPG